MANNQASFAEISYKLIDPHAAPSHTWEEEVRDQHTGHQHPLEGGAGGQPPGVWAWLIALLSFTISDLISGKLVAGVQGSHIRRFLRGIMEAV